MLYNPEGVWWRLDERKGFVIDLVLLNDSMGSVSVETAIQFQI